MFEKRKIQRSGRAISTEESDFAVFDKIYRRRNIDGSANPRTMQVPDGTATLYHFTHIGNLESIKANGLNRGDVPVEPTLPPSARCFNNAVWLTSDPDPEMQNWALGQTMVKRGVRIIVNVPGNDSNLWRWDDLATYLRIDPEWYAILNRAKGQAEWFVYCNIPIPPEWIVKRDLTRYAELFATNAIWRR